MPCKPRKGTVDKAWNEPEMSCNGLIRPYRFRS